MIGTKRGRAPAFVEPTTDVFRYSGWTVDPPSRLPLVHRSVRRAEHVARLRELGEHPAVSSMTFEAVLLPPLPGAPRVDVVRLERAAAENALPTDVAGPGLPEPDLTLTASVARQLGETETTWDATFLFNHFTAPSTEDAIAVWERVAGWYTATLGVDNSTLLVPIGPGSPFAFVNYVRIPTGAARFLITQLARPSFHREVRSVLTSHGMRALPLLVRPAGPEGS